MPDAPRPKQHLIATARMYPGAWRQADAFRAGRGKDWPDWPDWCFLPMAGWYAIVSADAGIQKLGPQHAHLIGDIGRLAALGTWRMTQGVYRFDPDLFAAVAGTPVEGDLPADLFYRLPEWCIYVETPGQRWFDSPLYGYFAHLEWDANTGREELRLVLDSDAALQPLPIHIGQWPLAEAVRRAVAEAKRQAVYHGATALAAALPERIDFQLDPLVSLLLYLCSEHAEIGDGAERPRNPEPKRTKKGWRLFAPDKMRAWDVGARIGAALRRGSSAVREGGDGTHASPRPHVRRAHWHTYLVGPGRSERRLKWLPPIPVNVDDPDALPVTIQPVQLIDGG
jgi:hypothetical protein